MRLMDSGIFPSSGQIESTAQIWRQKAEHSRDREHVQIKKNFVVLFESIWIGMHFQYFAAILSAFLTMRSKGSSNISVR